MSVRDDSEKPVFPPPLVVPGKQYGRQEISQMYKRSIRDAGEEQIFEWYLELGSVADVGRMLGLHPNSLTYLYHWLHEQDDWDEEQLAAVGGSTRWQRWKKLRRAQGHRAAEKSVTVLEDATPGDVRVKAEQSKSLRWLAERYAREDYGNHDRFEMKGEITLSASWAAALEADYEEQKVLEAEVVDDDDGI